MSAPVAVIVAPGVLTQASDAVETYLTRKRNNRIIAESRMCGAECTSKIDSKSCKATRHTLSQEEGSFDSQDRCKIADAGETRQGAIYLQN